MIHELTRWIRSARLHAAAIALVAGSALAFPTKAALAHTRLVKAEPAEDGRVASAPTQLRLTFSRKPVLESSQIELFGATGQRIAVGALRADAKDGRILVVPITGAVAQGRYTVRWRVASADGHPVRGEYSFTVGRASASTAPRPPSASTRQLTSR